MASADDNEGCEDEEQPFGHVDDALRKREIQVGMHEAGLAHDQDEHQRRGELQQELGSGGQAHVLFFLELFPVVQKADRAEHQGEQQHEDMLEASVEHAVRADGQAAERHGEDEHHAAHGGGAALALMPFHLALDLLPKLLSAQPGDVVFPEGAGEQEGQDEGSYQLDRHRVLPVSGTVNVLVFVSADAPRRFRAHPYGAFHGRRSGSPRGLSRQAILHHPDPRCQ